jgi:hypothetical protein
MAHVTDFRYVCFPAHSSRAIASFNMTEPRNYREVNIARKGLEDRVDLLQKWLWGLAGLLGTVFAAAVWINVQLGEQKTDIAVIKTDVKNVGDRLARIEKTVDDIRSDSGQILSRISRLEPAPRPQPTPAPSPDLRPVAGFYLTDGEAKLVRELLRTPPKSDAPAKYGLWVRVPETDTTPLPDDVVGKIPKLKGLRYAIDPGNNAIALVEPSGSVVATI